ncbi:MAG: S41 family peptidase [Christensenellales bacterium]
MMDDFFNDVQEEKKQPPLLMTPQQPDQPKPKKTAKIILFTVLVVMLAVAMFVSGVFYASSMGINGDMPMLIQAYKLLDKYYYKDISWSEFQEIATQAVAGSVDRFTGIVEATSEETGPALGVNITSDIYNRHSLSFIIPDSPAANAFAYQKVHRGNGTTQTLTESDDVRMQIGDRLYALQLDGSDEWTQVENMSSANLNALLGSASSVVVGVRTIKTDGGLESAYFYDYVVVRDYVDSRYAYYYSCEQIGGEIDAGKKAGLIKLIEFSESACLDFYNCVNEFLEDPAQPNKLILDLRGNGGGDADILGFIAKFLVKNQSSDDFDLPLLMLNSNTGNGKFVETYYSTLSGYNYEGQYLTATYLGNSIPDFEVVVLCNGGSASSSEALIGALQYYNNVTIVGNTTYGKGVAQKVFPLDGGKYYLYITNGFYYIPTAGEDGQTQWTKCIHGEGFTPQGDNYITLPAAEYNKDPYVARALNVLKEG